MRRGRREGGRAQTPVSTLLVLVAILAVLAPIAEATTFPPGPRAAFGPLSVRGFRPDAFGPDAPPGITAGPEGLHFDYVVIIVLENKGICEILTTCGGAAPYLTSLANDSGLAKHYTQCAAPSLTDYLCLTAASYFGCTTNAHPRSDACTWAAWNATNIVDRLVDAGLTWKAYLEAMPKNCDGSNAGLYAVKHNPFVYYGDIAGNATRCARVVPAGSGASVLVGDLASTSTASNYMWFTPDLCNDMHDCNVSTGDAYMATLVPQILNSTVFQTQRAALLITFDEDGGKGSPNLYTVWAGPTARRGFTSGVAYGHFSVLRTLEQNWGLAPLNANDSAAPSMAEFFLGAPTARFVSSPTWPRGNETITFNGSSSSSPNPNATLQYRWDWTDDGTWDTPWSADPVADHAYPAAGVYAAELEVQDSLGATNETTQFIPVDDAPPVTTDSLSGPTGQDGWYRGPVTVTLAATDDLSGVASTTYRIDGSGSQTYASPFVVGGDGNHTVSFHSTDRAGNVEASTEAAFRIDSVAPVTSATFSGLLNGSQFLGPILVTLTATDATSGVANTSVSIDGAGGINYTGPFLVPNVGTHTVVYFSFDRAGNVEAPSAFSVLNGSIGGIALDSRAVLEGTAGSSGWYTSAVNVTLLLMNGTSPPDSIWYRLDNGTWTQYAQPFAVAGDGVHTLDFNATDGDGLNEIMHHLTISIDTVPPTAGASVTGTMGNGGWFVSDATVSFSAADATSGVRGVTYRVDGRDWLDYTAPFSLGEGRHLVEFYATDIAGLAGSIESQTVNVDTTPPDSAASLAGTAGANGWFVSNVTVSLGATDATSGVDYIMDRVDGGNWSIYSGPFVLADGTHVVEFRATDVAGLTEAVRSTAIAVDTVAPTSVVSVSGQSGADGWFVSNVSIALGATDGTSGVAAIMYRVDGGNWTAFVGPFALGEGRHQVDFYAIDLAGNAEVPQSVDVNVDTTPPTTTASLSGTAGSNGWYVSNVTVTLSAFDGTSGIASVQYRVDGGTWSIYSGPFVLADGTHLVEFRATDVAGLTEAIRSVAVAVDTVAPTSVGSVSGQSGADGWFVSNVTVTLNATDATSGVAAISYRIDNGSWQPYLSAFVIAEGRHQIDFFATDVAGIVEPVRSILVAVDTTPPSSSATVSGTLGNNGWYVSNVTVSLSGRDATSGVAGLSYRVDGGAWTAYSGSFVLSDGVHAVEFFATDLAGLIGPTQSLLVAVDTTPPVAAAGLSGQAGSDGWFVSNVTVSLNATDGLSGTASLSYRIDGGEWLTYSAPFLLTEGVHQIDFFAIDLAGNVEVSLTVTVAIDTSPPTTSASVSGTPGSNGWYVSNATVSLTASDATSGVVRIAYRIDGGEWTDYAAPFVVSDGSHTIEFYAVDLAGLVEATHAIMVAVDTNGPTSSAAFSGRAGENGWFVSDVTVFLNATDSTSGVANVTYRVDQGPWQEYLAPFVLTDGPHWIDFYATDVAGNAEPLRSVNVAIDTTPPTSSATVSGTRGSNGWYVSNATVSLNASDDLSGVAGISYRIDGGAWTEYSGPFLVSEGVHTIEFFAVDAAGNTEETHSIDVSVDTTAPSSTADVSGQPGADGWLVSNVTVSLGATDATSGVAVIMYRVDAGNWTVFAGPFALGEGRHHVDFYAVDLAGNAEVPQSVDVHVDTTPPTTTSALSGTVGSEGWYVSNVTITLTAFDGTSGVASVRYRVDGGAWLAYSGPFAVHEGVHVIDYFATDAAGLSEPLQTVTVQVDTTPPVTAAELSGTAGADGWFVSNVTVSLNASDATSGPASVTYRLDGGSWSLYAAPFVLADGVHTVEFFATDVAGNAEPMRSLSIAIDTTPPTTDATATGTLGQGGWYLSPVTISLHATDPGSGIAEVRCRVDEGTWTTACASLVVGEGVHTVEYYATNGAGLLESIQSLTVRSDLTPPATAETLSGDLGDNGWYRSNVTVTLNATDGGSGVAGIQYRVDGGSWNDYSAPFLLLNGQHILDFYAFDVAGNVEPLQSITVLVNTIAPITTASVAGTSGNGGWYVSDVIVTLTATDGMGGVDQILVRLNGGAWTPYAGPITLHEGRHVLEYYATDRAGNLEPTHVKSFDIDTTDPVASATVPSPSGQGGWYLAGLSVRLAASDGTSGITGIFYQIDDGGWQHYTTPFPIGAGRHVVRYYATDLAGRSSSVGSLSLNVDPTAPTTAGTVTGTEGQNGWYVSDVVLTLQGFDGLSGIATVRYRIDGGPWLSYSGPFTLAEGGTTVVEFAAVDIAGNTEAVHRIALDIDASGPTFTSLTAAGNETGSTVRIAWEAADDESGIAGYEVRVDGGPFTAVGGETEVLLHLAEGSHVVEVRATNRAGLSTTRSVSVEVLTTHASAPGLPTFVLPIVILGAALPAAAFAVWRIRDRRKRARKEG